MIFARWFITPDMIAHRVPVVLVLTFYDAIQLMSLLPEYFKFHVLRRVTSHVYFQEGESYGCADLKSVLILSGREVFIVCPYFFCELKVLVSRCLIQYLLKLS